jgi:TRAP transporter 4TM/12TM fusion protein
LPVFIVNIILILYTLFGYLVPGMFNHPGLSVERLMSALSLEMSTGVFERLPQLGLTLIGSFLLLLAALRAFGCIDSILQASSRLASRAPSLLPQAAVIGSFAVAAVSGSGAANAATTGTATIPMFVKANFPRAYAAAVETASSLGGQLMPPLMGISAFMMAEFLRVSYFEVVARGFAPAIIYFVAVAVSVYLLALRYQTRSVGFESTPLIWADRLNLVSYLGAIVALIYLMGVQRWPAMTAAQTVFLVLLGVLTLAFLIRLVRAGDWRPSTVARPFLKLVEVFTVTTSELVILLSTLGILTASFTVTGVPDKVGVLLMELADVHLIVLVLVAFLFGYLVGMGLPVTPTYIITAVVVTPFMIRAGVDPWVAHFFAFFVAVFGELSPPTSVTAAVTSRIAETSFMRTMVHAISLCLPLMVMMAAVFTRPGLVVEPGLAQIPDFLLVLLGTLGLAFCLQSRFAAERWPDIAARGGLAVASLVALLHTDPWIAGLAAVPVGGMIIYGFRRSQRVDLALA